MGSRYQATEVDATTSPLWCRNCGGPLLVGVQEVLDPADLLAPDLQLNMMMSCIKCATNRRDVRPDAGRIGNRLLYWLILEGRARVRTNTAPSGVWTPPKDLYIHESTITANSARSYFSEAVRGIQGVYVATHSRGYRTESSYMLGHLKVNNTPCHCKMA